MKLIPLILGTLVLSTSLHGAQDVRQVRLDPPVRSFPEPFSNITGLRQLADGRLVVADRLEQAVRMVDLTTGRFQDIGRVGEGPGEYQMPGGLLPLPADSTLLIDFGNMRMSVISAQGRITRSTSLLRGDGLFVRPTAADHAGWLYFDQGNVRISRGGAVETSDTTPIRRMDVVTETIETVATLPRPTTGQGRARSVTASGGTFRIRSGLDPYPMQNVWSVAPDGRIAVVYAEPYHVEWIASNSERRVGPPVAYRPVRITENDKEAWADRLGGGTAVMMTSGGTGGRGGGRTVTMPRPDPEDVDWPETKPPFPRQAARVTPEGDVWVERHVAFGAPPTYDVFDETGQRRHQIVLPEGRQLVGFGREVAYLVHVDRDDLQRLEEYRGVR